MLVELYEIGLTQMLLGEGFKCEAYFAKFKKDIHSDENVLNIF